MGTPRHGLVRSLRVGAACAALAAVWAVPCTGAALDAPSGNLPATVPSLLGLRLRLDSEWQAHEQAVRQSEEDEALIARGRISPGGHVGGVLLSLLPLPTFGAGQAVQGRWHDAGKIFAVVDGVLLAALLVTRQICANAEGSSEPFELIPDECVGYLVVGFAFLVGRAVQLIDAIAGPFVHDRRVAEAEARRASRRGGTPRVGLAVSRTGMKGLLLLRF